MADPDGDEFCVLGPLTRRSLLMSGSGWLTLANCHISGTSCGEDLGCPSFPSTDAESFQVLKGPGVGDHAQDHPAPTRAALIPVLVAPDVAATGVGVPDVGWFCQHWATYPAASEDPPVARPVRKHT
jgi:hypothetical protein